MAKRATPKVSKSKAEVQAEFVKIQDEFAAETEGSSSKRIEAMALRDKAILEQVHDLTVEKAVGDISKLSLDISKSLSQLSVKIVEKIESLNSLKEAIEIETDELARIHKLDIAATALDQMLLDYDEKQKRLEEEVSNKSKEWEYLQETKLLEQKEYDDALKKARQREKEEFEYSKNLERKKEQDKYDEAQRVLLLQNKEKQSSLEKSWSEREQSIKIQENELNDLKKEAQEFPERIKKEVTQAVSEAVKDTAQKYQQQILIMQKEIESDRRLAELKIKSLEDTVTRQFTEIEILHARVEEAKKQVQDIAVKAIESTSGAKALDHINQIAMEQAKHRNPQS